MGNNRQNSAGSSKSAATPVDHYRRSIGKHQEKMLSEGNIRKKLNQQIKKQAADDVYIPEASKTSKIIFFAFWVLVFGGIYVAFKLST